MLPINIFLGLGIFLYGMSQLEAGIRKLSYGTVKRWIFKLTDTPSSSVMFGTIVTSILQSSSLVSLIVLALASANLVPLYNAVGMLLGANLGTTITGWLVTILGFKLNLQQLALPLVAFCGFSQRILKKETPLKTLMLVLLGIGLLLFGLSIMKQSIAEIPRSETLSEIKNYSLFSYLLFGAILTILIQSSSATMMLTLAALNAQIIALPEAASLVIGADLGTTSTTIFGSISGSAVEKQLAASHVIFNMATDFFAFFILLPFLPLLMKLVNLQDPLFALVSFHSFFNLIGLLFFIPILRPYSLWCGSFFEKAKAMPISIDTSIPEITIATIKKKCYQLYLCAIILNLRNLKITQPSLTIKKQLREKIDRLDKPTLSFDEYYDSIKKSEALIAKAILKLQQQTLKPELVTSLDNLLNIIRGITYCCKTLKDIRENLAELRNENSDLCRRLYNSHCKFHRYLYSQVLVLCENHPEVYVEEQLKLITKANNQHHLESDELVYQHSGEKQNLFIYSSLLNINHEIHHSAKNLLSTLTPWHKLAKHVDDTNS